MTHAGNASSVALMQRSARAVDPRFHCITSRLRLGVDQPVIHAQKHC